MAIPQKGKKKKRSKEWHRCNSAQRWLEAIGNLPTVVENGDYTAAAPTPLPNIGGNTRRGDAAS